MKVFKQALCASVAVFAMSAAQSVLADPATAPAGAPAATPAPAPAAPASNAQATPAMGATLNANSDPLNFTLPYAGKIFVTGAITGIGLTQSNVTPGDHSTWGDISNAQVMIQKSDGIVQFFIQAGDYSLPALGTPYVQSNRLVTDTFGAVPVAYLKIAPTSWFSIEGGKLPTLVGAEGIFTFQNINIERGLLWNQEPVISQGVQVNVSHGPVSASLSFNDGYYSQRLNWLSGLVAWTINPRDSLSFVGAGSLSQYGYSQFATPVPQNNSEIFNLIFQHTQGNFMIQPYIQYSTVSQNTNIGLGSSANSWAGAVLAKYSFTPSFALAGRFEYISTGAGSPACAYYGGETNVRTAVVSNSCYCYYPQTNLAYGPGSDAWSITVTPTYTYKIFFARGEFSYTKIGNGEYGFQFGHEFANSSQVRGVLETGIIF